MEQAPAAGTAVPAAHAGVVGGAAGAAAGGTVVELTMQQALNRALADALAADDRTLVFGEDVGRLGGVFRVTDGLRRRFGARRVFDTPLAESAIVGMAVGLAMSGWRPIPELQFDGFAYPALDQIVNQLARMHYRSRGTLPMPVTLRVPSYGGIQAPEHHGESLEALFAHVPGLKVVSPSTPREGYRLLRQAVADPDPVVFMEPKSRYWDRESFDPAAEAEAAEAAATGPGSPYTLRIARRGRHATLVTWGAMVKRCLEVAELAAEDGVELEVVDLRWLSPLDAEGLAAAVRRTGRVVVVHEAPRRAGLGAEISALVMERCFDALRAPVARVTGYDVPTPAGPLEAHYLPDADRILLAVQAVLEG